MPPPPATRHQVIGKIPDEWVVGCEVYVELQHQAYVGYVNGVDHWQDIIPENETKQIRRIVAKPLPVGEGCTCDMCEFISAEKAMEELGVKQETDTIETLRREINILKDRVEWLESRLIIFK